MSKNRSFFESKLFSLKRQKLDQTGMFWRTNKAAVHASYAIALHVAKTKKPHNIGETLLKPCILESVKLVMGEKASQTMKQISLSNDTIKSRIREMSDNIKSKVLSKIDSSPVYVLQLDESTDISNFSQLLVYVRYVADERINEEFLFCQPLETTSKAVDVFQKLVNFFDKTELSWSKLVGVCTDGAPATHLLTLDCKVWIDFPGKAKKSSNSRNTLHDSQSGACFKNHSEEISGRYVCGN